MPHAQEVELQTTGTHPDPEHGSSGHGDRPRSAMARRSVRWWLTVMVDMLIVLCGFTASTLLGRLYYNNGGNSKWLVTLMTSGGSPLLAIVLLLTPRDPVSASEPQPSAAKMVPIYVGIGILIGSDNLMYAYSLQYLPVSTFSLVAATQLAFNAVTSRLINKQRFTALIANSVFVLTLSAVLLGVSSSSDGTSADLPRGKYALGFILALVAAAIYALIMSLYELTFQKVVRSRTFRWVLRLQMWTNVVAAMVTLIGLLASGEWKTLRGEVAGYKGGRASYVATVVGTALLAQVGLIASLRLIRRVSALFANVTGTVALPLVPVLAVLLFGDKMTGIKAIALIMAVWGFLSYAYQHYIDSRRAASVGTASECSVCLARDRDGEAVLESGHRPPSSP